MTITETHLNAEEHLARFIPRGGGDGRGAHHQAAVHLVPVAEVLYFEAADKYLRVLTAGAEYLIRTPLKELIAQLDPQVFWQIHRGTVVRASLIDTVTRKFDCDLAGIAKANKLKAPKYAIRPGQRLTLAGCGG